MLFSSYKIALKVEGPTTNKLLSELGIFQRQKTHGLKGTTLRCIKIFAIISESMTSVLVEPHELCSSFRRSGGK